jgi:hypothetical protein
MSARARDWSASSSRKKERSRGPSPSGGGHGQQGIPTPRRRRRRGRRSAADSRVRSRRGEQRDRIRRFIAADSYSGEATSWESIIAKHRPPRAPLRMPRATAVVAASFPAPSPRPRPVLPHAIDERTKPRHASPRDKSCTHDNRCSLDPNPSSGHRRPDDEEQGVCTPLQGEEEGMYVPELPNSLDLVHASVSIGLLY